MRHDWAMWLSAGAVVVGLAIGSSFAGPVGGRILAGASGLLLGVLGFLWALGGDISALHWRLGVEGELETAREIEKLGAEWHCEHDLVHGYGNWDHIVVGPAGVFLLDSKLLSGRAVATGDALNAGRLSFSGWRFRRSAGRVKAELEKRLGFGGLWVQSVAVVWGDFPQKRHGENRVVYVNGNELVPWLLSLPEKLTAPQRAALKVALSEVRIAVEPSSRALGVDAAKTA